MPLKFYGHDISQSSDSICAIPPPPELPNDFYQKITEWIPFDYLENALVMESAQTHSVIDSAERKSGGCGGVRGWFSQPYSDVNDSGSATDSAMVARRVKGGGGGEG